MTYLGKEYRYTKETVDFNILCSEFNAPTHGEKLEVVMELDVGGFPFYRLKFVNREGYQYFDLAKPLMKYYIEQGFLQEYQNGEMSEEYQGMIYNPIDGRWRWL